MAKLSLLAGTTSYIAQVFIQDSSSTTGAGLTGLTNASGSLTAYFHRDTDTTATAISLVTMTVGTFTSSGFKEIDATNMPGWYQFCPPNTALASGAKNVAIHLKGATNMAPCPLEIELTAVNNQSTTAFMTGVNSIAPPTNWNLDSIDASGRRDISKILGTAISTPATAGVLDVNVKNMNNVAATSITTINANQGTTQPVNFTGTGASALAKSDMVDIAGAAVSVTTAQIGANMVQVNGQVASAAAGVTFPASIASPTNITAGTITTVTNLTNAPTAGDLTAAMKTSVTTAATAATPAAASVTGSVGSVASGGINRASFAADTGLQSIRSNTAQAGAAGNLTLDASASAVTDFYVNCILYLTGGTGAGQARFITAYNGTTKVATANSNWKTTPDATTTFAVMDFDAIPGATAPTAAQVATAVWQDLLAGADFGTASSIGALLKLDIDGTISSRLASASISLSGGAVTVGTNNDKTGYGLSAAAVQAVWDALTSALTTVGSVGKRIADFLTGDAYVRLGAPAGASVSADVAAVKTDTGNVSTRLTATRAGYLDNLSAGAVALDSTVAKSATLGTPAGASVSADIAAVKTDTAVTLGQTGTTGVVVAAASKTGYRLSVTGVDDVWAYLESSIGTTGSIGLKLKNTLPQHITKNTALAKFPIVMVDSADHLTPKTGLTVSAQRSIDGGAFGACTNAVVEVGSGVYVIDLSAADLNGNTIALRFTATGADTRLLTLITEPAAA